MKAIYHIDQARENLLAEIKRLTGRKIINKALLIEDLFARFRIVIWENKNTTNALREEVSKSLSEAGGSFWAGPVWLEKANNHPALDQIAFDQAWEEGKEISAKIRVNTRFRRGNWISPLISPPWQKGDGPNIVSFYSLKGGVGRTTALAAFAIQLARIGQRVVVIDLDLDAPGIGTLITPGIEPTGAQWGVVDYLLEQPVLDNPDLREYYHVCNRSLITRQGAIHVFPAGVYNEQYLGKLARIDIELSTNSQGHPLLMLLGQIRDSLGPDWILLDTRAGLSEVAGLGLNGIAHLNVLFGTFSEQSWSGLAQIIKRFGEQRVQNDLPQIDCLLVQAMTPANPLVSEKSTQVFVDRAEKVFESYYYAENPEDPDEDRFWYIRDMENTDSPHRAIPIHYTDILAFYNSLDDIADRLAKDEDLLNLSSRIQGRFRKVIG